MDSYEMPRDLQDTDLRAAAITAAQLGKLIEELRRQDEPGGRGRSSGAISEDLLWGDGEAPGSQGQAAPPGHLPARRPHDCDWEPFVDEPFSHDPFSHDPFSNEPFSNEPNEPFSDGASNVEPLGEQLLHDEPLVDTPHFDENCFDEPLVDMPRFDEACFEEPLDGERFGGEPADHNPAGGRSGESGGSGGAGGATGTGPSSTLPRREETRPARILYLEADPAADRDQMAAVRELLEAAGYRMLCGHPDDFDCIDLALGADLLLIDLPPAAGSARDLLRPFWTDPAAAAVPVIFITADPRAPAHAVSAGGSDHLTRPVEPQLLLATVAARLASQRALQRLFAPAV